MFVNFTNHPYKTWSLRQKAAAAAYGSVADLPFPAVDPAADEAEISRLADGYEAKIAAMAPQAVLCQGEFTLCHELIQRLTARGIRVLAACTQRVVSERADANGQWIKQATFEFVRFRCYKGDVK